ncbi:hypothetical protein OIDMADRAFT_103171 [Oidiodendron maius Zn]|uniref:VPS9 domain-containing protein n=1 Tax=Oidiodendron maius (strain Zn) TaxID=913774 RepID=A0A0C3HHT6_OIDMZ|nr:hypothetical protein OIDMADRAFT_103171 [Oidiodendron maius Zn]
MSSPRQLADTSKLADVILAINLSEARPSDYEKTDHGGNSPDNADIVTTADGNDESDVHTSGNQDKMTDSQAASNNVVNDSLEGTYDVGSVEVDAVEETCAEIEKAAADQDGAPMESSTATLKPQVNMPAISSQHLSPEDQSYLDPTPQTPLSSRPPSRSASSAGEKQIYLSTPEPERSPTRSDVDFDEKNITSEDERDADSRTEIQSIMDQFSETGQGPGHEEVMSPRLELASPLLGSPIQHPPRKSSLEPLSSRSASFLDSRLPSGTTQSMQDRDLPEAGPAVPPKPGSIHGFSPSRIQDDRYVENSVSPPLHRPPPPEPEPEPDLPFDFHRFLEQLRHRTADPVAKFLRSFLQEFGKKQWMVHEQVKIIGDFLLFITNKMAQCEVWRDVSDAEFANAREGMEKLVMNRLYTQTFSPAIPPPQPIPGSKPKRKGGERPLGPGRRGQHQEDVERDDILAQKVSIYGWIREEHLDIPPVGDSGKRFLVLAQQELLKIKTYRAPRDKIICVLNCCKVIFGLLKHSKSDSSADSFMPLLIYVVLQANPEHLVSNVQYILRFRNQEKLGGEAGYYLSSLLGAVQFIENLDRTSLTISDEEFEQNVEAAVSAIAEKHQTEAAKGELPPQTEEKIASTRRSAEAESSAPRHANLQAGSDGGEAIDEKAAISGLLRTIQQPFTSIGRIFSEESSSPQGPPITPLSANSPRASASPRISTDRPRSPNRPANVFEASSRSRLSAEDSAARQASAEAAEAQRIQRAEHSNVVETLAGMFPDLDRDIISDVVTQKDGRVGLAVDACLALSS